jgi:putative chitinase
MVTPAQIRQIIPKAHDVERFFPYLADAMEKYQINSPRRIGAFISQIGEESCCFQATVEYASGKEYEGRDDLGNTQPGDGVKFKGRGLIQVTGRTGYASVSRKIFGDDRLVDTPTLMGNPDLAALSAGIFWDGKMINNVCDNPETWIKPGPHQYTKFQWITILVNGGLNGYAERLSNYNRAKTVLNF